MWAFLVTQKRKKTFELSSMPFTKMGDGKENKEK